MKKSVIVKKWTRMTAYAVVGVIVMLLFSCGARARQEQAAEWENRPEWLRSTPTDPDYYIGIGSASKSRYYGTESYQDAAKKDALADLASNISVKISSTSLLNTVSEGSEVRNDFQQLIKSRTDMTLTGFQIYDSYETPTDYYVIYRLSREEYRQRREREIRAAVARGLGFFDRAVTAAREGDYRSALVGYFRALDAVKEYFNENLTTEWRGEKIDLSNRADGAIADLLSGISFVPFSDPVGVVKGSPLSGSQLGFYLRTAQGTPLSGMPVSFFYGAMDIRGKAAATDSSGRVACPLGRVTSPVGSGDFEARLDLAALVREATRDPLILRYASRYRIPQGKVRIEVSSPRIRIGIEAEDALGERLHRAFLQFFEKRGVREENSLGGETCPSIEVSCALKTVRMQSDYYRVEATVELSGYLGQESLVGRKETFTASALTEKEARAKMGDILEKETALRYAGMFYNAFFE